MALLTEGVVRARAQQQVKIKRKSVTASLNEAAGPEDRFNVFLSHSSAEDEEFLLGVKALLEDDGLSVYVDRYSDPHLSPDRVTRATAILLRQRLRASASLVYAYSSHSTMSRWMPWELGFFDGMDRPIAVLPVVPSGQSDFRKEEYLGLYPNMDAEVLNFGDGAKRTFVVPDPRSPRSTIVFREWLQAAHGRRR
jgi:hypothetical protein